MSTRRYRPRALLFAASVIALLTVATGVLWWDVLGSPTGRSNAAYLLLISAYLFGGIYLTASALGHLPDSVRPARPLAFVMKVAAAAVLIYSAFAR